MTVFAARFITFSSNTFTAKRMTICFCTTFADFFPTAPSTIDSAYCFQILAAVIIFYFNCSLNHFILEVTINDNQSPILCFKLKKLHLIKLQKTLKKFFSVNNEHSACCVMDCGFRKAFNFLFLTLYCLK